MIDSRIKEKRSLPPSAKDRNPAGRNTDRRMEVLRTSLARVENLIGQHPGTALSAGFLIGVVAAWWIKRK
jgi:hypothetical protein